MFQPKTYLELCMAMQLRAEVHMPKVGKCLIQSIAIESGSGRSWNVGVLLLVGDDAGVYQTIHFRV